MYNFLAPLLRPLVLGFFAGVLLASLAGDILGSVWFLAFLFAPIFVLWGFALPVNRKVVLPIGFFFLAFSISFFITPRATAAVVIDLPVTSRGEVVSVEGTITDEPDERDRDTRLTFRPDGGVSQLLLVLPSFPQFNYGDRLRVIGRPEEPQTFETDIGRVFDYPAYLRTRGIGTIMYQPQIESLNENRGVKLVGSLFAFKTAFLSRLDQALPEPQSSLLGGLVVGGKRSLARFGRNGFVARGLSIWLSFPVTT